jgi:hypothetical protein
LGKLRFFFLFGSIENDGSHFVEAELSALLLAEYPPDSIYDLLLPEPFGPTTPVTSWLIWMTVSFANDLKPLTSSVLSLILGAIDLLVQKRLQMYSDCMRLLFGVCDFGNSRQVLVAHDLNKSASGKKNLASLYKNGALKRKVKFAEGDLQLLRTAHVELRISNNG